MEVDLSVPAPWAAIGASSGTRARPRRRRGLGF
uniref:Uncharacterized protein n=1 Tax=Arundo donax TaxID=35708 RepID=A0A0A9GLW1_ARUDO